MPLGPNPTDPNIAGVRRETRATEAAMLATDIQASGEFTAIPAYCASCSAYKTEKVTIPNAVIMDLLVSGEPTSPVVTGEALAKITARDPRITAKTAANPKPHPPSSRWGALQIMQRAIDMRNQGLIPFSPFHPFIEQDGLRDRDIYAIWVRLYLQDLPEASRLDLVADDVVREESGTVNGAQVPESMLPSADDMKGPKMIEELDAVSPGTLIDEVPAGRDDVLKWVGKDRDRAIAASFVEGQRTNGRRKTVDTVLVPLIGE